MVVVVAAVLVVVVVAAAVVVVVIVVVGGGPAYVRDGTYSWHHRTQNTAIPNSPGFQMAAVAEKLFWAFYVQHVSACGNSTVYIIGIGSRHSQG